ncbi:MAG: AAA family ATPase, partial [Armatimonadetes bacterium]|nr:AAA family ATPase [Armatimonadota bacterium]
MRLFMFLRELTQQRIRTVRTLDQYEAAFWLADLPREEGCSCAAWGGDQTDPDVPWLSIRRPSLPSPPRPPAILKEWLAPEDIANSALEQPELRRVSSAPANLLDTADEDDGDTAPGPEVEEAWISYCEAWWPWAEKDRQRRPVLRAYNELFGVYQTYQRSPEDFELVLGVGYLTWKTPSSQVVQRHLVTARAQILFDATGARLHVVPDGDEPNLKLEQDMLEVSERPAPAGCTTVESLLADTGGVIWQGTGIHDALRAWVHGIRDSLEYQTDLTPQREVPSVPQVRFAPALILRKRGERSIVEVLNNIRGQLQDMADPLPAALVSIVADPQTNALVADPFADTAAPAEALFSEIYFPRVANDEQLRVAELAMRHDGVLVQGPPGTGKSHTIANLVSHLLATGKRILVTSQAPRALQVLRDLLPPELAPLCVVALGADPESVKSLEQSVQGICAEHGNWDREQAAVEVDRLERSLDDARRREARLQHDLRAIREKETAPQAIGSYQGTLQTIARKLREDEARHGWVRARPPASEQVPLTDGEAVQLLGLMRKLAGQTETELLSLVADPALLWSAKDFDAAVRLEAKAREQHELSAKVLDHPQSDALCAASVEPLKSACSALSAACHTLGRLQARGQSWAVQVAGEAVVGNTQQYRSLSAATHDHLSAIDRNTDVGQDLDITGLDGVDHVAAKGAAADLHSHLEANGSCGWWLFQPRVVKTARNALRGVRANGKVCETVESLAAVLSHIDTTERFEQLASLWRELVSPPETPSRVRCAQYSSLCEILDECLELGDRVDEARGALGGISSPSQVVPGDLNALPQTRDVCAAALDHAQLRDIRANIEKLQAFIQTRADALAPASPWHSLARSVSNRDTQKYSASHREAVGSAEALGECQTRDELLSRLGHLAPSLVETLEHSYDDPAWDDRIGRLSSAWEWAQADTWLAVITAPGAQHRIEEELLEAEKAIRSRLAELTALHAWRHCLSRLTENETQHLRAWQKAIARIGKGTGKYVPQYRREARRHMEECRSAIPAWIMPIYRVAETIPPGPGIFDAVIVDEASQAGPEALFLNYLGKTIIVVGDDKQISPAEVGVDRASIAELRRQHIADIPHNDSIGADNSFFDLAEIVYKNQVRLREHFR